MKSDLLDLDGGVAFVTGAGQGAGRGIALELARHNPGGVAVNDFVADRAAAVAAEITAMGVPAIAVQADVSDHASVTAAHAAAVKVLGPVTILVNNAGNAGPNAEFGQMPLFWDTSPNDWERYLATNLLGVMNCCHVALPAMVERKHGRIVTILSDAGRVGQARLAAYAAAKAGAGGFVRAIARETGRHGITCNAISLSTLEPPLEEEALAAFFGSDRTKAMLALYPIPRLGKPADVAGLTAFLCSGAASWITGQTYPVNGGYSFAV